MRARVPFVSRPSGRPAPLVLGPEAMRSLTFAVLLPLVLIGATGCDRLTEPNAITVQKEPPPRPKPPAPPPTAAPAQGAAAAMPGMPGGAMPAGGAPAPKA